MMATGFMGAVLADAAGNLSAVHDSDLFAALLISLFLGVALGILVTCMFVVLHFLRKNRAGNRPLGRRPEFIPRERRFQPPMFNLPARWLAVRSGNPIL